MPHKNGYATQRRSRNEVRDPCYQCFNLGVAMGLIFRCAAPFVKMDGFIYNLVKRSHEFTNKYFAALQPICFLS